MDRNEEKVCLIISNGIQNVCRICAQMFNNMKTIYDYTTCSIVPLIKIVDMLQFLQIPVDDKCPYLLCATCENDLFNAYNLKLKSEHTRFIFHEYIQQENILPMINNARVMIDDSSLTINDSNLMIDEVLVNNAIMINIFDNLFINNLETETDNSETLTSISDLTIEDTSDATTNSISDTPMNSISDSSTNSISDTSTNSTSDTSNSISEITTESIFNTLYEAKQKLETIQSNPNTCKLCLTEFTTPEKNYQHNKVHDKNMCFVCKQVMKRRSYMKQHMNSHKQHECSYTCNICKMNFNHPNLLIEHHKTHSIVCITCNFCRKSFMNYNEVFFHNCVRRHGYRLRKKIKKENN